MANPFRNAMMRKAFDGMLMLAHDRGSDLYLPTRRGLIRHYGGLHRVSFWQGVDSFPRLIPRDSLAWACYRAGAEFAKDLPDWVPPSTSPKYN